ncbi:MAG: heme o synthase [Candidatus Nitrosocaldaceae archaeon]
MSLKEYIEISKLRIVMILDLVAVTTLLAASKWQINPFDIIYLLIAGSLASMGSAAINHYYDRDIDSLMSRTSTRPIPAGRIKPKNALIYGILLSVISVIISYLTLNLLATAFIALGIIVYDVIYTLLLKRKNASNIVIGGFAGSCASYAGWATATGSIDLLGFLVGLIVFIWTPTHFWTLAIKIKEEYANAKVPMLPVLIGEARAAKYILLNTAILVPYSIAITFLGLGLIYLIISIITGLFLIHYDLRLLKNPSKSLAWRAYMASNQYLMLLFLGLMFDGLYMIRFTP